MRSLTVGAMAVVLLAPTVRADAIDPTPSLFEVQPARDPWHVDWTSASGEIRRAAAGRLLPFPSNLVTRPQDPQLHAAAIEHSSAYQTRAKIHKVASFATLPLFATELALGQSIYNTPANSGGKRSAHIAVGAGIIGLFAVNTVTGVWNMLGEGRKETKGRTLRLVHGLLMLAADVGFLATWASGPSSESEHGATSFEGDKVTHRNLAVASISIGTAGYLLMLFGNH